MFQDLPIVLFGFCIVVVVILESRSPGSVVTLKEDDNRSWNAPRRPTFQDAGKKCRFCRCFFAVYRRGLTPFFFFLVNFGEQRVCKGGRAWWLKAAKKGVFARSFCPSSNKTESHGAYAILSVRPLF